MVKLILKGGLGNQMFQYAFAKSVAIETKQELILDTSFLDNRIPIKDFTVRGFDLDLFNIKDKKSQIFNKDIFQSYLAYPIEKLINKFNSNYVLEDPDFYKYDGTLVKRAMSSKNPILEGYFNNYNYFSKHAKEIKDIFDTTRLYDKQYDEIEKQIKNSDSVSINIRRGDYLNAKHKDVYVLLGEKYYKKAIQIIREKITNPHFYIFSVDFTEGDSSYFVNDLGLKESEITLLGKNYIGDRFKTYLRLISLCKHNIISNSTFSFFGGFLNNNIEKIIVCPRKWGHNVSDFNVPSDWVSIEN